MDCNLYQRQCWKERERENVIKYQTRGKIKKRNAIKCQNDKAM